MQNRAQNENTKHNMLEHDKVCSSDLLLRSVIPVKSLTLTKLAMIYMSYYTRRPVITFHEVRKGSYLMPKAINIVYHISYSEFRVLKLS